MTSSWNNYTPLPTHTHTPHPHPTMVVFSRLESITCMTCFESSISVYKFITYGADCIYEVYFIRYVVRKPYLAIETSLIHNAVNAKGLVCVFVWICIYIYMYILKHYRKKFWRPGHYADMSKVALVITLCNMMMVTKLVNGSNYGLSLLSPVLTYQGPFIF